MSIPRYRILRLLPVALTIMVVIPSLFETLAQVIVSADQPSLWTLEQAHYLLEQMHRRNLDLRAKGLEPLDPNLTNGVSVDLLQTFLGAGIQYNGADRFNNGLATNSLASQANQRQQLTEDNASLSRQSVELTSTIAQLNIALAHAQTQEEKDRIQGEIDQDKIVEAKVDKQLALNNDQLKTLNAGPTTITGTQSKYNFDQSKGALDKTMGDTAKAIIGNADANSPARPEQPLISG